MAEPQTTDIVARLRAPSRILAAANSLKRDAAEEIERLRSDLGRERALRIHNAENLRRLDEALAERIARDAR